jgi:CBS domain-containing protein
MRPVKPLESESSLERAAGMLRDGQVDVIPVHRGATYIGVVTEKSLARALENGCAPGDSVECAVEENYPTAGAYETGAEALRLLAASQTSSLLVLDSAERILGVISASDLYPKKPYFPKPPMIGGMATPFGVYLTTGALGAGVSRWALVSTGAVMAMLFALGGVVTAYAFEYAANHGYANISLETWQLLPMAVLFIGMRLLPLSGIHAAEHKVVHAIERGEELEPQIVSRMPRVHPRCGTNLFAGATIFLAVFQPLEKVDPSLAVMAGALSSFLLWRPVGGAIQWLVTTRPPSQKHIQMGIKSGRELLEKYRLTRGATATPIQRIWNSGLLQVLFGFTLTHLVIGQIETLLNIPSAF